MKKVCFVCGESENLVGCGHVIDDHGDRPCGAWFHESCMIPLTEEEKKEEQKVERRRHFDAKCPKCRGHLRYINPRLNIVRHKT